MAAEAFARRAKDSSDDRSARKPVGGPAVAGGAADPLVLRRLPKYISTVPETAEELDGLLRAIANPHRRLILQECWLAEHTAGELAELLDLAPASTSEHLKVLRKHELVEQRVEGTFRIYRSRPQAVVRLRQLLEAAFPTEAP
jgi:DNA-binding transcriptional ArsR family regulator